MRELGLAGRAVDVDRSARVEGGHIARGRVDPVDEQGHGQPVQICDGLESLSVEDRDGGQMSERAEEIMGGVL